MQLQYGNVQWLVGCCALLIRGEGSYLLYDVGVSISSWPTLDAISPSRNVVVGEVLICALVVCHCSTCPLDWCMLNRLLFPRTHLNRIARHGSSQLRVLRYHETLLPAPPLLGGEYVDPGSCLLVESMSIQAIASWCSGRC